MAQFPGSTGEAWEALEATRDVDICVGAGAVREGERAPLIEVRDTFECVELGESCGIERVHFTFDRGAAAVEQRGIVAEIDQLIAGERTCAAEKSRAAQHMVIFFAGHQRAVDEDLHALIRPARRAVTKRKKKRLDELLLAHGYFADAKTALGFILSGKIVVDSAVISKPGTLIAEDAEISIRGELLKYASRGGYKLEGALERFSVRAEGKVVLDAGASTGGFTDCLLQYGAKKVYSVDVGFGQLRGKLAADPRVVNLERTNIGDLTRDSFAENIQLCTFDLSYLTVTKAAPALAQLFLEPVEIIALVKPLYEGIDQEKKDDPDELEQALLRICPALAAEELELRDLMVSPIRGTRGSVEFLAHLARGRDSERGVALSRKVIEELRVACASPPGT